MVLFPKEPFTGDTNHACSLHFNPQFLSGYIVHSGSDDLNLGQKYSWDCT